MPSHSHSRRFSRKLAGAPSALPDATLGRGGTGRRAPCEAAAAPAVDRLFWPVIRWKRGFYSPFRSHSWYCSFTRHCSSSLRQSVPGRCHAGPGQTCQAADLRGKQRRRRQRRRPKRRQNRRRSSPNRRHAMSSSRATIRALFSNRGGELKSWTPNRFADDHGRPVDLVPHWCTGRRATGFALIADDAALTNRLGGALYRASTDRACVGTNGGQLVFEYSQDASGLQIRKQFDFQVLQSRLVADGAGDGERRTSANVGLERTGPR